MQAAAAGEESSLSILSAQERRIRTLEAKLADAKRLPRPFLWKKYGPKEGLDSTEVYRILETPDGRIWAGGIRGLHQFDGLNWTKVPGVETRCHGLLFDEAAGTLWAGFEGGIYRLLRGETTLERVDFPSLAGSLRTPALGLDARGRLWVTSADGLYLRDPEGKFALQKSPAAEGLAYATPVFSGVPGQLLIGTESGLYSRPIVYEGDWTRVPDSPKSRVLDLEVDGRGTLYVATADGLHIRGPGGRWTKMTVDDGLPVDACSALVYDGRRLWIGTWGGLCALEGDRLTCLNDKDGLGSSQVREVFIDSRGLVWSGTRGSGASVLNPVLWSHFGADLGLPEGYIVYTHHVDPDQAIWFEAGRNGLVRVALDGSYSLTSVRGAVRSITRDSSGRLWVGRQDSNPAVMEGGQWRDLPGRDVRGAYFLVPGLEPGQMWAGTYLHGLFRYSETGWKNWGPNELKHGFVRMLFRSVDGTVFLSTLLGDLWTLPSGQDTLKRWDPAPGQLPTSQIQTMAELPGGEQWLGTALGLVRIRDGKAKVFTVTDGLADNDVRAILLENSEKVWVGTAKGLSLFDGQTWVNFGPQDGIPGELVTGIAKAGDSIWLTGSGGFVQLNPDSLQAPETRVAMSARSELTSGADADFRRIPIIQSRDFTPWIQAQTPWWRFSDRVYRYSYRLDDGPWSQWMPARELALHKLSTGEHRLEVRAKGPFFQVDPTPAVLRFVVELPLPSEIYLMVSGISLLAALLLMRELWRKQARYVGPYRLLKSIGRGGAGHVWKARDLTGGEIVALKVLHPFLSQSPEVLERFRREGETAAQIDHPNVSRLLDRGEHGGKAYLAMEFLDARTLRQEVQRLGGCLPVQDALEVTCILLEAIEALHSRNLLHLDLKPDNVLVLRHGATWRERLRVTDFGLAEWIRMDRGTASPSLGGSLCYQAPEQALGKPLDVRADIYSVAVILYELVAGHPPFRGSHDLAILQQMMSSQLPPLAPQADPGFEELQKSLRAALAPGLHSRPATASEFRAELRRIQGSPFFSSDVSEPRFIAARSPILATPDEIWTTSLLSSNALELRRRLRLLFEVIEALLQPNLDELLKRLLDRVMELFGAEHAFIFLKHADGSIELRAGRGEPHARSASVADQVIRTGVPEFLVDEDAEAFPGDERLSLACVPFLEEGIVGGALYLDSTTPFGSRFSLDEGNLLTSLATLAATAIANARALQRREEAERAASEMQEQVQQAQKMETVGTLAGGIAHDFNNLLSGMIGTLSMVDWQMSLPQGLDRESLSEQLQVVRDCALRAAEIVQQLMSLSRRAELRLTTVDLGLLAGDVVKMCKSSFDPKIHIAIEAPEQSLRVDADPVRIKQVLLNLALNARDAMPDGGSLEFQLSEVQESDDIAWVQIRVRDSGQGIEAVHLPRIFDPFFTTKPTGRGTGLGLAMVYGIVTQHKGTIQVDSQPGQGTVFQVRLPRSDREPLPPGLSPADLPHGDHTILVVDDELVVRQLARGMLQMLGFRVLIAADGEEAIQILQQGVLQVDLVVLDWIMPKLSGRDTLLRLRELDPQIPVLLTSGIALDAQALGTRGLGTSGLLAKPYELTDLAIAVHLALEADPRKARRTEAAE